MDEADVSECSLRGVVGGLRPGYVCSKLLFSLVAFKLIGKEERVNGFKA